MPTDVAAERVSAKTQAYNVYDVISGLPHADREPHPIHTRRVRAAPHDRPKARPKRIGVRPDPKSQSPNRFRRMALKYLVTLNAEEGRDLSAPMAASPAVLIPPVAPAGFGRRRRWSRRRTPHRPIQRRLCCVAVMRLALLRLPAM